MHDLVLLGGGHAHVAVLRAFGMRPQPGVRLTLIGRDIHTPYSGMLPGLVAGHYAFDETHIDLAPLARFAGARLYNDSAVGLDLAAQRVLCAARPPVPFDTLSIDTGATPSFDGAAGAAEHAVPVKPIDRFHTRWSALLDWVLQTRRPIAIGIVGGGAGGVELLLAVRHRLRAELRAAGQDPARVALHLLSASERILPDSNRTAQRIFARHLAAARIAVHDGFHAVEVRPDGVRAADGRWQALDRVLWVTGAVAASWPAESGLACTADGFIRVDSCLRSLSHPAVFAAGDIASIEGAPRPKAGVFAVRQGKPLARNLRAAATGGSPRRFRPQRHHLRLISTGPRHAVAVRGPFALQGDWVWRWKDRIDRRFMRRYGELPAMPEAAGGEAAMRCAGCGAKLPAEALRAALAGSASLPADWDDAAPVPGSGAAAGATLPGGAIWASIDGFRWPVDDPWAAGRIAVHHAMSDLHAMGAAPTGALVFAALPHMPPHRQEAELRQLMQGVQAALRAEGAVLLGGHSAEGAEAMIAVAALGQLPAGQAPWRKAGLQPGDVLLLSKPLGTGAVLAAAMRGRAQGRWWLAALDAMLLSQAAAACTLRDFRPSAATDVTGFGLAGHLAEMLAASGVAAQLHLAAIPLLPGAAACALDGIESSAAPGNRAGFPQVEAALAAAIEAGADPWWRSLLFDPQTGGGLLAGVAPARAEAALLALRAAGCAAARIGEVLPHAAAPPGAVRFR